MQEISHKHILYLTSWYPDRITHDNGDFIQRHAQSVSKLHKITVLYAVKDPLLKDKKYDVVCTEIDGLREVHVYVKSSRFKPLNLIYLLQAYLIGLKQIKKIDLIHLNVVYPAGLIALLLKIRLNKPIILTEHWSNLHPQNFNKLPFYKRIFIQKVLKNVDYVLPVSDYLGKAMLKINPKLVYEVIPNVVDISKFNVQDSNHESKIKFLHLSNLAERAKNVTGMLNVAKKLAIAGFEFEFHIGGNGDLKPIFEFVQINNLEKFIFPFGRIPHENVNQLMQKFDCFVLFSRYENQPCVQIESFASGLPLIASNVGGIGEFFPGNFGILIESENEESLYQAMKNVIEGKSFSSKTEMNLYAKNNFSNEVIAFKISQVYQKMLSK